MAIYENQGAGLKFRVLTCNLSSDFHRIESTSFSGFHVYAYFETNPFYPFYDIMIGYHVVDERDLEELYGDKYCYLHCEYELLKTMEFISGLHLIEELSYE